MKNRKLMLSMVILICFLTGCAYSSVSIMNLENRTSNKITRSSSYWSGIQKGSSLEVNEGDEIDFYIEMEKGSVTLTLKDKDGNEVYTLTKDGKYSGTETYMAEKQEKLWLTEKGKKFKGKYEITWGKSENDEVNLEKEEEEKEQE